MNVIMILLIIVLNEKNIKNFLIIVKHAMKFMEIVNVIRDMFYVLVFRV